MLIIQWLIAEFIISCIKILNRIRCAIFFHDLVYQTYRDSRSVLRMRGVCRRLGCEYVIEN